MSPETYAAIVRRGLAMRAFVERVAERGDVAVTELEDLVVLRALAVVARAAERTARGERP
jgi:hypothetical protein